MNIIWFLFSITKGSIVWETEAHGETLRNEMKAEYDKLQSTFPSIYKIFESVWVRFILAALSIPAARYIQDRVHGIQRHNDDAKGLDDDFDDDDDEDDDDAPLTKRDLARYFRD